MEKGQGVEAEVGKKKKHSPLREMETSLEPRFLSSSQNYPDVGQGHSFLISQQSLILPRQDGRLGVYTGWSVPGSPTGQW